jgi:hypothetical protein
MPYGKKDLVDFFLGELEHQKHYLTYTDPMGIQKQQAIQAQVRYLPFGVIEYIFPESDKDMVLNSLEFHDERNVYDMGKIKFLFLRKFLKCEKAPEFKRDKKYLWLKDNVNIIPIGVRYDKMDYKDENGNIHEAI